jgi:hypothetical protein
MDTVEIVLTSVMVAVFAVYFITVLWMIHGLKVKKAYLKSLSRQNRDCRMSFLGKRHQKRHERWLNHRPF